MATPLTGLTEQEVVQRQAQGLGNQAAIPTSRSYAQILRENVFTFINNVLFALGAALVLLGRPSDALVSVGVIFINVIVSVVQEIRAKRTLDKIALVTRPTATVIRDGQEKIVDPSALVVGDLCVVRPGDQVVVDGVVVGDGKMDVDESLLTGESDHIPKMAGNEVFSGSFCVTGSAVYEAQKVGVNSLANQLTTSARAFRRVLTPLQQEINLSVRVILIVAVYFEMLLVINGILNRIPVVDSVKIAVVIAGLIPNGLFLAIALAYAMGAVRIAGKGALVQQSNAVESLSNVDTLCLDKTGTLTSNRIAFEELVALDGNEDELRSLLGDFAASGTTTNRTAGAIAAACPGQKRQIKKEVPFSSEWKWSGVVFDDPQRSGTYVLGAPEILQVFLDESIDVTKWVQSRAEKGMRVVLFTRVPEEFDIVNGEGKPSLPGGLKPLGLVSLSDELRPEAKNTLKAFQDAGVKLKIISGDNPKTVAALARQAGLGPDFKTVSGLDLVDKSPQELEAIADETTVFGRITPQQKQQLVRALKARGHYVAMIGDGVNDVLSLKQSNLGIAMQSGSQAARGVADIILLNDSFKALPPAVSEGQRIINGMQDILKLFMTRVLYSALLIVSTGFIGGFPFSPKHNSLLTFIAVGVPTLALAAWARPGPVKHGSLIRRLLHFVLPATLTLSVFGLGIYLLYLVPNTDTIGNMNPGLHPFQTSPQALLTAQTALTIFSILCGLFLVVFVEPPSKRWVGGDAFSGDLRPSILAIFLTVMLLVVSVVPSIGGFFDLIPLNALDYLILFLLACLWAFLVRWMWRSRVLDRFLQADFEADELLEKDAS